MIKILIVELNILEMNVVGGIVCGGFLCMIFGLCLLIEVYVVFFYGGKLRSGLFYDVDGVIFSGFGVVWFIDVFEVVGLCVVMEVVFVVECLVWGFCNGMQLVVVVLGGVVGVLFKGYEVGLVLDFVLIEIGVGYLMMVGCKGGFVVFCVYCDEVQVMFEGVVLFVVNDYLLVQVMVYEKNGVDFWGMQYYLELLVFEVGIYFNWGIFEGYCYMQWDFLLVDFDLEVVV